MDNVSFKAEEGSLAPAIAGGYHSCSLQTTSSPTEQYEQKIPSKLQGFGIYWKIQNRSSWSLPQVVKEDTKMPHGAIVISSINLDCAEQCVSVDQVESSPGKFCNISFERFALDSKSWNSGFRGDIWHRRLWKGLRGRSQLLQNWILVYPCLAFAVWALLFILFGRQRTFVGGSLFSLIVLEVAAIVFGEIADYVQLPPAFGMLIAGIMLRNVPEINVGKDLTSDLSNPLRAMSVVVLLTRGAFSVDPSAIKRLWKVVPQLTVISCVTEAVVASVAVFHIIQFPLQWSALMGCIMSAMSGAIVLPVLSAVEMTSSVLNERKEAVSIAKVACGLDAILAICMAEFALGFVFSGGELYGGLSKGVLEVVIGGAFGILWGSITGLLLSPRHGNGVRSFGVFSGGCMSLLGLTKIGFPRGGPLAVFLGSFIVASLWRRRKVDGNNNDQLQQSFTKLWYFFQPLLFGIIGARTDLDIIDWSLIGKGTVCVTISICVRALIAFTMTSCVVLTWQQRLFIAIAWMPKGTVQAALGPVALETARELNFGSEAEELANKIMNLAVLVIIFASIIGCACLRHFGKVLLKV